MAQGEHFEVECRARLCESAERQNKQDQQGCHRPESLSPVAGKFNGSNAYGVQKAQHRVVVHDRDSIYSEGVDRTIAAMGLTGPQDAGANAASERLLRATDRHDPA